VDAAPSAPTQIAPQSDSSSSDEEGESGEEESSSDEESSVDKGRKAEHAALVAHAAQPVPAPASSSEDESSSEEEEEESAEASAEALSAPAAASGFAAAAQSTPASGGASQRVCVETVRRYFNTVHSSRLQYLTPVPAQEQAAGERGAAPVGPRAPRSYESLPRLDLAAAASFAVHDVIAYKVTEIGPTRAPCVSGWRLGRVTAVAAHDSSLHLEMRPWPNPHEHPMQADWQVHCHAQV